MADGFGAAASVDPKTSNPGLSPAFPKRGQSLGNAIRLVEASIHDEVWLGASSAAQRLPLAYESSSLSPYRFVLVILQGASRADWM
jgi:hypothetical protein